jgi:predicted DCC family thiol-disulfide oxidoreductase YuxK
MSRITVIFDGDCEFCRQSVTWIQRKLVVQALAFQTADLQPFNLTKEQCAKQVYVISNSVTYSGADAIRYLLKMRGNRFGAFLLGATGNLGRAGYRWVASHRNSLLIKLATRILTQLNRK